MALAAALKAQPNDAPEALRAWEVQQIKRGRATVEQSIILGKRSVEHPGGSSTSTNLAERFQGISSELPVTD
jgi:hypothetical protein